MSNEAEAKAKAKVPYLKGEGFYLDPSEVKIDERARKFFDKDELERLKESIGELGQLQPILVTKADKTLVAGERRTLACRDLGRKVWAAYFEDVDQIALMKAELHENVCRAPLTAVEELRQKHKIAGLLRDRFGPNYSERKIAKYLEESHTLTSEDLKLAEYVINLPAKFEDCKSKQDVKRRVKDLNRGAEQLLLQRAVDDLSEDERFRKLNIPTQLDQPITFTGEQFSPEEEAALSAAFGEAKEEAVEEAEEDSEEWIREKISSFNQRLLVGDAFEELPKLQDESIDIFMLDPPWGVGLDEKIERGQLKGDGYKDSQKKFLEDFPKLVEMVYAKLRKDGFLFCFFAIQYHNFVFQTLQDCGFNTNWRPIVVCKDNIRSSQVATYWPSSSYEPVAFAKKGSPEIINRGAPDHLLVRWLSPNEKYGFISAKPAECYLYLLRMVARPGAIVCDPMYGSGSAFVACEQAFDLRLNWFGWDSDDGALTGENKRRSLLRLSEWMMHFAEEQKLLAKLGDPDVGEVAPAGELPDSYEELTPGTPEWKLYWELHPEKQQEMIIFKRKLQEAN